MRVSVLPMIGQRTCLCTLHLWTTAIWGPPHNITSITRRPMLLPLISNPKPS